MRRLKSVAVATVAIALVFSSVPLAFAGMHGGHGEGRHGRQAAPFSVTRPAVVSEKVVMGTSFDATGLVLPAIAADDTSTTVALQVYGRGDHGRPALIDSISAALSAATDTGTVYSAAVTLPDAGEYTLVAAVSQNGVVVAQSRGREIDVVLPYAVSRPRVVTPKVVTGTAFDATGVVVPSIAADDASTTVSVLVMQVGRHHRQTQVASIDAALSVADTGTAYTASITLPTAGKYVLVAVVMRDGVVLGRSRGREMRAADAVVAPVTSSRHR
jgi:hypothetical protein